MVKINNISNNTPAFRGMVINSSVCNVLAAISKSGTAAQRGVIGSTAAVLQPNIDLRNKNVDEETRTLNASRSIARAIVGTITGIAIRCGFIALAKRAVKEPPKNIVQKFFSTDALETARKAAESAGRDSKVAKDFADKLDGHGEVAGTVLALGVMLFTNFLVDVPLTHKLSMKIKKEFFEKRTIATTETEKVEKTEMSEKASEVQK